MADGDLASVLSGPLSWDPQTAPLALKIMQNYAAGANPPVTDPSKGSVGGILANIIAGSRGAMAQSEIGQLAQMRQQALPQVAALRTADDPWAYIAQHPELSGIATGPYAAMDPAKAEELRLYQYGVGPNMELIRRNLAALRQGGSFFAGGGGGGARAGGGGGFSTGSSAFPAGTPYRYQAPTQAAAVPTSPQAASPATGAPQVPRPVRQPTRPQLASGYGF